MEYQDILDINIYIKNNDLWDQRFSKHSVVNWKDYFKIPDDLDMGLVGGILYVIGIIVGMGVTILICTILFKALNEVRKLGLGVDGGYEELKKCGWCLLILILFIPAYFYVLTLMFTVQIV